MKSYKLHLCVILNLIVSPFPNSEVTFIHHVLFPARLVVLLVVLQFFTLVEIISDVTTLLSINIIYFCSICRKISVSSEISASAGRPCIRCWTSPWCVSVPPKGTCALGNSCSRCSSSDCICLARCFGELYHSCSISLLASRSSNHWQGYPKVRNSCLSSYDDTFYI
jgi:hypothetical protein